MSESVLTLVAQGEEATRALPMPSVAYFIITFALFLAALAATWAFRNTAHKVQSPTHVDAHGRIQIEGHPGHTDGTQH